MDYLTTDTELTSVADAIRAKGGTSAALAFPSGFASAIEAIPTGGGGGYTLDEIATRDFSDENVVLPTATFIMPYSFCSLGIKSVSAPLATAFRTKFDSTGGHAFDRCSSLETVDLPEMAHFGSGGYHFYQCTSLKRINLPKSAPPGQYSFARCTSLITAVFGADYNGTGGANAFNGCTSLIAVDYGGTNRMDSSMFSGATCLNVLVLRRTSGVCSIQNIDCFTNTPFASGNAGGILYVPQSLISDYQSASNWSTILGYANNQIKSIESTHTDPTAPIDLTLYYADGTPISA